MWAKISLTAELKRFAIGEGADVVGVAGADSFKKAPKGHKPTDFLPDAKAAVVVAVHVPKGTLESPNLRFYRNTAVYLEHQLDRIAHKIAGFLEERGYLAVPVPPDLPINMREDKGFMGDLSHKHAAVEAGLGQIGKNSLLITRKFGPKVRLVSVITNAPLDPDPKHLEDLCNDCNLCVDSCPAVALNGNGEIDKGKCMRKIEPYGFGGLLHFIKEFTKVKEQKKKLEMLRETENKVNMLEFYQALLTGHYECAECVKVCPIGK